MKNLKLISPLLLALLFSCKKDDSGCTDPTAANYNPSALSDDGSCFYPTGYIPPNFNGDIYTSFSENWDDWDFTFNGITGSLYTQFSEDWDNWYFNYGGLTGDIETSFSENWDDWNLSTNNYSISIYTTFSENWDGWKIDDDNSSWDANVTTSFSENWDDWDVQGDSLDLDISTSFSENWDDWNSSGNIAASIPKEYILAAHFVPIIVNVLRIQEIIP